METLSNLFRAVAEVFGYARDRQTNANTVPMKAASEQQAEEALKARASQAIADGDLDEIRRLASK